MEPDFADMFVRINPRFKLRGWLDRPYALVDSLRAAARFIPKGLFETLQLCNGTLRASDFIFGGPRKQQIEQLAREGVLSFSVDPCSLEPAQEYRYYPNHYMRQVQWSMTGRCNYHCRHCFMSAPHGILPQPSTEECLRIADQMAECGVQVVKLTGGECLIRKDFLQIVDRLLAGGVQIATILSNGALINDELLDAFEERGVLCGFDISFDGTDGWHDWLRNTPGAEQAALRAFELCRKRGFPTGAQLILHRGNAPSLRKTIRLLGELGVSGVVVGSMKAEGEALDIKEQLLSYEEFFNICCEYLPQFLEDGSPVPALALGGFFEIAQGTPRLARGRTDEGDACMGKPVCTAIQSTLYLSSDGFVLPCIPASYNDALKELFPNIASMTLADALTNSSYFDFISTTVADAFACNPTCQACAYRNRCMGGCRVKATNEDGSANLMGRDRQSCRYFLGGYYDRAREFLENLQLPARSEDVR